MNPLTAPLTQSWFEHSSLFSMFEILSQQKDIKIIINHGSIRCMRGAKVLGDRETSLICGTNTEGMLRLMTARQCS